MRISSGVVSAERTVPITSPSRRTVMESVISTISSMSWVMTMTLRPMSRSFRISAYSFSRLLRERDCVTSSSSSSCGSTDSALASSIILRDSIIMPSGI